MTSASRFGTLWSYLLDGVHLFARNDDLHGFLPKHSRDLSEESLRMKKYFAKFAGACAGVVLFGRPDCRFGLVHGSWIPLPERLAFYLTVTYPLRRAVLAQTESAS